MSNLGKKWESDFKRDWKVTFENSLILRLYDTTNMYKGVQNPCDYITFVDGHLFLVECKETKGNTFSIEFRQKDELKEYIGIKNVHPGVILWFSDHQKVVWIPIETFLKLEKDGKKSFNVKMLNSNDYEYIDMPLEVKRIYVNVNYNKLLEYYNES